MSPSTPVHSELVSEESAVLREFILDFDDILEELGAGKANEDKAKVAKDVAGGRTEATTGGRGGMETKGAATSTSSSWSSPRVASSSSSSSSSSRGRDLAGMPAETFTPNAVTDVLAENGAATVVNVTRTSSTPSAETSSCKFGQFHSVHSSA